MRPPKTKTKAQSYVPSHCSAQLLHHGAKRGLAQAQQQQQHRHRTRVVSHADAERQRGAPAVALLPKMEVQT